MNAVENQVKELVFVELESANRQFPQFHSQHEGWEVMLEEYKELEDEYQKISSEMEEMISSIRMNDNCDNECARVILRHAVFAACESIQVAAMAQKYLNMEERE